MSRTSQRCIVSALCLALAAVALLAALRWERLRLGWHESRLGSIDPAARMAAAAALLSMGTDDARKTLRDVAGEWVETSVRAVDAEEGLLVLSAGREHGVGELDRGIVLEPSGGLRGKFTVIKVYPELSGARIDPGVSAIERGDLAFVAANAERWGLSARAHSARDGLDPSHCGGAERLMDAPRCGRDRELSAAARRARSGF